MNHFTDALKNHYADFSGRATRSQYWYFVLFSMIFSIIASIIDYAIFGENKMMVNGFYNLAVLIPSISIGARRLHDTGKSGWRQLVGLIPLLGTVWFIILLATDTVAGDNQYGPQPTPTA